MHWRVSTCSMDAVSDSSTKKVDSPARMWSRAPCEVYAGPQDHDTNGHVADRARRRQSSGLYELKGFRLCDL